MQWPGINRQEIDSNESSCTTPITGVAGYYLLVLFPIILSLWIAFLWAKSEVNNQLRTFAQLALDKSELVIRQADLVSDAAERYQGQVCTPAHQKRMLNIIRGYLYINELIYARDNHFYAHR